MDPHSRRLSEPTKDVSIDSADADQRLSFAVAAIQQSGLNVKGQPNLSIREAAKAFRVPKSTLSDRYHGKSSRADARKTDQKLPPEAERALVAWIKTMGERGLPMSASMITDCAADICKQHVGESWVKRFRKRHPDLKVRWTTGLEQCRARALNPTTVHGYFKMLGELIEKYGILPQNMWNMDEKGVQPGIGERIAAFVDRDVKVVYQVENGNRELVTIIEAVCADGRALHPSVIYQGQRRDLEWGRDNPCKASISYSSKGWTDQDLGFKWLERDFEPGTRDPNGGYRLLILDGHNSHCTYRFCKFAADHKIIVVCLPSHTTHALQPCDVGVFGPLAKCWKTEVNHASAQLIPVTKHNLLSYYHKARSHALKPSTIQAAFSKTGIWPFNPDAVPAAAFAPSLLTTTKPALPSVESHPVWLGPKPVHNDSAPLAVGDAGSLSAVPSNHPSARMPLSTLPVRSANAPAHSEATPVADVHTPAVQDAAASSTPTLPVSSAKHPTSSIETVHARPQLPPLSLPPPPPYHASREQLRERIADLTKLLESAYSQAVSDHATMVLMERENGRLRQRAFQKEKRMRKHFDTSQGRHMTCDEVLDHLARVEWELNMKDLFKEAGPRFKAQKAKITAYKKAMAAEKAAADQKKKSDEREEKRIAAEVEKTRQREEKARAREEQKKDAQKKRLEQAKLKKQKAEEKKAAKALEKSEAAAAKAARVATKRARAAKGANVTAIKQQQSPAPAQRPRPRPRYKTGVPMHHSDEAATQSNQTQDATRDRGVPDAPPIQRFSRCSDLQDSAVPFAQGNVDQGHSETRIAPLRRSSRHQHLER